jgi:hypothetical protein
MGSLFQSLAILGDWGTMIPLYFGLFFFCKAFSALSKSDSTFCVLLNFSYSEKAFSSASLDEIDPCRLMAIHLITNRYDGT